MKRVMLIFCLFTFAINSVGATGFLSGNVSIQKKSFFGNDYEITLTLYRDFCNTNFSPPPAVYGGEIRSLTNHNLILSGIVLFKSNTYIQNNIVNCNNPSCVEVSVYRSVITIQNNPVPDFYYINSSFNRSAEYINSEKGNGATWTGVFLSTGSFGTFNNTPTWSDTLQVEFVCNTDTVLIDYSANDPSGDSLFYSIVPSSDSGSVLPLPLLPFKPGYSASNIFGDSSYYLFNQNNGELIVSLPVPGNYSFTVKCEEYRSGTKISESFLDVILPSLACDSGLIYDTIDVISCDSFITKGLGNTYNSSGVYVDTIYNVNGCTNKDSVVIINLTVNSSYFDTNIVMIQSCSFYTFPSGKIKNITGIYYDTLETTLGCDSIHKYNLTIQNSPITILSDTTCASYYLSGRNLFVNETGVYYDTLINNYNCDSIVEIHLLTRQNSDTISFIGCLGDTHFIGNSFYTSSGVYQDTFQNIYLCDSIIVSVVNISQNYCGFYEDFANGLVGNTSSGAWTVSGNHGSLWKQDFDGSSGPNAKPHHLINSVSKVNGFMLLDIDSLNRIAYPSPDGNTILYTPIIPQATLTSPVIDLSTLSSPVLEFTHSIKASHFLSDNNNNRYVRIELSTDNFSTISETFVLNDKFDRQEFNENIRFNIQSAIQVNPSNVQFRYVWERYSHYYWQIDDVVIYESPDYDVKLSKKDTLLNEAVYYYMPESQLDSVRLGFSFENSGSKTITNVGYNIEVTGPVSFTENIRTSDSITYNGGKDFKHTLNTLFNQKGTYNVKVRPYSNDIPSGVFGDSLMYSFEITDSIYGLDNGIDVGAYFYSKFRNNQLFTNQTVGNVFYVKDSMSVVGASTYVARGLGLKHYLAKVNLDNSYTIVDSSINIVPNSSTLNTFIYIPFTSHNNFVSGDKFIVLAQGDQELSYAQDVNYGLVRGEDPWAGIPRIIKAFPKAPMIRAVVDDYYVAPPFVCATVYDTINDSSICGSYLLPSGLIVDSSGFYNDTLLTGLGCDSVLTYSVIISNYTNRTTKYFTTCEGAYVSPNGNIYVNTGVYQDTLVNQFGCDSIETIYFTRNTTSWSYNVIQACAPFVVPSGTYTISTNGLYVDTITNAIGCDSLIDLDVTFVSGTTYDTITVNTCDFYVLANGVDTLFTSGTYYDTSIVYSCNNIKTIYLTINTGYILDTLPTVSACDSIQLPYSKRWVTTSGTYFDTLFSPLTCDTAYTISYIIQQDQVYPEAVTSCHDYILPSGNDTLVISGVYYDSLLTYTGCDSIVEITFTRVPLIDTSVSVNGHTLTANLVGASYQWLYCNGNYSVLPGETNRSYTPEGRGSYAVEVTANGCVDTSSCFYVDTCKVFNYTNREELDGSTTFTLISGNSNIVNVSWLIDGVSYNSSTDTINVFLNNGGYVIRPTVIYGHSSPFYNCVGEQKRLNINYFRPCRMGYDSLGNDIYKIYMIKDSSTDFVQRWDMEHLYGGESRTVFSQDTIYDTVTDLNVLWRMTGSPSACYDEKVFNSTNPRCEAKFLITQSALGSVTIVDSSYGTNMRYYWSYGDGTQDSLSSTPSHTYTSSGAYLLCLNIIDTLNPVGCRNSFCDSVIVDSNGLLISKSTGAGFTINVVRYEDWIASVDENKITEMVIYPNPSTGIFTVNTKLEDVSEVEVYTVSGRKIMTNRVKGKIFNIDLSSYENGQYLIRLKTIKGPYFKRLILNR